MGSKVTVIEKNKGQKIAWKQSGTKLTFGDDELTVNVAKYQRDWATQIDICGDKNGNLVIGVGEGRYYVAQVDVPATQYTQPEPIETVEKPIELSEVQENETGETMEETYTSITAAPAEPIPLEMSDVVLTLWATDGLRN